MKNGAYTMTRPGVDAIDVFVAYGISGAQVAFNLRSGQRIAAVDYLGDLGCSFSPLAVGNESSAFLAGWTCGMNDEGHGDAEWYRMWVAAGRPEDAQAFAEGVLAEDHAELDDPAGDIMPGEPVGVML